MEPMDPTMRLPASVLDELEAQAAGTREAAPLREAASVILLRDGDAGLELFLMLRHATMAFASGMAVFPGGGVDKRDYEDAPAVVGPGLDEWAVILETTPLMAGAVLCAAIRELFEETGILLAGSADAIVTDTDSAAWESRRARLEDHELSMSEVLRETGLSLRTDLLRFWSEWSTPTFEPRRYKTWFFVAVQPAGQPTRADSSEALEVRWMPLEQALDDVEAGRTRMLPPQYCTCLELAESGSAANVLASSRVPVRVAPAVDVDANGAYLVLPQRFLALGAARPTA
jgi:8-oxo-dGTP pyrophosphatase MutT (NUDIX family)